MTGIQGNTPNNKIHPTTISTEPYKGIFSLCLNSSLFIPNTSSYQHYVVETVDKSGNSKFHIALPSFSYDNATVLVSLGIVN